MLGFKFPTINNIHSFFTGLSAGNIAIDNIALDLDSLAVRHCHVFCLKAILNLLSQSVHLYTIVGISLDHSLQIRAGTDSVFKVVILFVILAGTIVLCVIPAVYDPVCIFFLFPEQIKQKIFGKLFRHFIVFVFLAKCGLQTGYRIFAVIIRDRSVLFGSIILCQKLYDLIVGIFCIHRVIFIAFNDRGNVLRSGFVITCIERQELSVGNIRCVILYRTKATDHRIGRHTKHITNLNSQPFQVLYGNFSICHFINSRYQAVNTFQTKAAKNFVLLSVDNVVYKAKHIAAKCRI